MGADVQTRNGTSGGKIVAVGGSEISFSVPVETAGTYRVFTWHRKGSATTSSTTRRSLACDRLQSERGSFLEYQRNTWLQPGEMWRTIRWGVAFNGTASWTHSTSCARR